MYFMSSMYFMKTSNAGCSCDSYVTIALICFENNV